MDLEKQDRTTDGGCRDGLRAAPGQFQLPCNGLAVEVPPANSERIVGNSDVGPWEEICLKGDVEISGLAACLVEGIVGLIGRLRSLRWLIRLRTIPILG